MPTLRVELFEGRTVEQKHALIAKLTDAIALVPEDPDAYAMRGEAQMELREWAKCADDLQLAMAKATA